MIVLHSCNIEYSSLSPPFISILTLPSSFLLCLRYAQLADLSWRSSKDRIKIWFTGHDWNYLFSLHKNLNHLSQKWVALFQLWNKMQCYTNQIIWSFKQCSKFQVRICLLSWQNVKLQVKIN